MRMRLTETRAVSAEEKNADKSSRIEKIRGTMKNYIESGIFADAQEEFIYVERKPLTAEFVMVLYAQSTLKLMNGSHSARLLSAQQKLQS